MTHFFVKQTSRGQRFTYDVEEKGSDCRLYTAQGSRWLAPRALTVSTVRGDPLWHTPLPLCTWLFPRTPVHPLLDCAGQTHGEIAWRSHVFTPCSYQLRWHETTLHIEEIGMGKQGFKFPVFDGQTQVALLEKGVGSGGCFDVYELLTIRDELVVPLIFLVMLLDTAAGTNQQEWNHRVEYSYAWTSKKRRSLYDPQWKQAQLHTIL